MPKKKPAPNEAKKKPPGRKANALELAPGIHKEDDELRGDASKIPSTLRTEDPPIQDTTLSHRRQRELCAMDDSSYEGEEDDLSVSDIPGAFPFGGAGTAGGSVFCSALIEPNNSNGTKDDGEILEGNEEEEAAAGEKLVVAELAHEVILGTAVPESDLDATIPWHASKTWRYIGVAAVIGIAAVLIVIILTVLNGGGDSPSPDLSDKPTTVPTTPLVLTILFHATNGEDWVANDMWLSSQLVCEWYGVGCENYDITLLEFSTYKSLRS
jgi:hypothetical protein